MGGGDGGRSAGTESVLFRVPGAQLHLVDGQKNILMAQGDFSVVLVKQDDGPLAAILGSIHDYQWPIAKDAPTVRHSDQSYVFSFPEFSYRVVFSADTSPTTLSHLDSVLQIYGHINQAEGSHEGGVQSSSGTVVYPTVGCVLPPSSPHGLTPLQHQFQQAERRAEGVYASPIARHISTGGELCCKCIEKGGELASVGIKIGHKYVKARTVRCDAPAEVDLTTARRIERAKRMSALAKSLSKLLLSGALTASETVAATVADAVRGSPSLRPIAGVRDVAIASVDAFSKLMDSAEIAGKKVLHETCDATADIVHHKYGDQAASVTFEGLGAAGNVVSTIWTLNKLGVKSLAKATAKAAAVNVIHDSVVAEGGHANANQIGGGGIGGGGAIQAQQSANHYGGSFGGAGSGTTQDWRRQNGSNTGDWTRTHGSVYASHVAAVQPQQNPAGSQYSYVLPPVSVVPPSWHR